MWTVHSFYEAGLNQRWFFAGWGGDEFTVGHASRNDALSIDSEPCPSSSSSSLSIEAPERRSHQPLKIYSKTKAAHCTVLASAAGCQSRAGEGRRRWSTRRRERRDVRRGWSSKQELGVKVRGTETERGSMDNVHSLVQHPKMCWLLFLLWSNLEKKSDVLYCVKKATITQNSFF